MGKIAARAFPAFAVGFALFYAPAYSFTSGDATFSWPLFTYFPSIGDYGELYPWLVAGSDERGPPMWWYGWIASSVVVGLIFAGISLLLPESATTSGRQRGDAKCFRKSAGASSFTMILRSKSSPALKPRYSWEGRA